MFGAGERSADKCLHRLFPACCPYFSHPTVCRWLTKKGSFIGSLKERFATLQIGPDFSPIFDYKEDEHALSVKGAYTFGPATKCVAGEATGRFPANLVLHLEVGPVTSSEKVTQVPCCFDSEEERDSFRAAVEWAVNAKSHVAAFRSSQGAEKKRRDTETLQRVQSEELEALRLEADVAAMKQRVEEGEAAYRKSSVDRGSLSQSLSKEKESFEALMQRLALEQEAIRAQVALDLEQSRLSADEASVRVKSLAESNVQTSASVSDMQATLDQKFVDFRKREASNTVLRVRPAPPEIEPESVPVVVETVAPSDAILTVSAPTIAVVIKPAHSGPAVSKPPASGTAPSSSAPAAAPPPVLMFGSPVSFSLDAAAVKAAQLVVTPGTGFATLGCQIANTRGITVKAAATDSGSGAALVKFEVSFASQLWPW